MVQKQVVITGRGLTINQIVEIANDSKGEVDVVLGDLAKWRIGQARENVEKEIEKGTAIYGTTTRTGPEKGRSVPEGQEFQKEVAAGYGGRWGTDVEYFLPGTCRVGWVILLNQFAQGSTIISPELSYELCAWINTLFNTESVYHTFLPKVEKNASISYADLTAPMQLMLETLAKHSITQEDTGDNNKGYEFKSGEVLALGSSNCFTMAETMLSLANLENILKTCEEAAAMDIEAERSTPFIVSKAAEEIAQWNEKKDVINRMRAYLKDSRIWVDTPSSIHPHCTLRASPDIIASAWEALNNCKDVVHEMINGHQGNPAVVGYWNSYEVTDIQIGPVCSFDSTRLFCALSSVQQAVGCLAVSIAQRTEHLINNNGGHIPQLFSRRFEVFTESSLRDCLMTASVIPAVMGRMNCSAGYDWAAPAAQAAAALESCSGAAVRLIAVNLLVSAAVIRNKLGEEADAQIGSGLQKLFKEIQKRSFQQLEPTQPFSFADLINYIHSRISHDTNDAAQDILEKNDYDEGYDSASINSGDSFEPAR